MLPYLSSDKKETWYKGLISLNVNVCLLPILSIIKILGLEGLPLSNNSGSKLKYIRLEYWSLEKNLI